MVATRQYWWHNSRLCHILETNFMDSEHSLVIIRDPSFSRKSLQSISSFYSQSLLLTFSRVKLDLEERDSKLTGIDRHLAV